MDWFMHHPVLLGLVGAGVAVGYGLYLTWWLLQQAAGNERMQEIARAGGSSSRERGGLL